MTDDLSQTAAMTTPMTSKHDLLTIPPEVFERIALEAEPQDLLQVRLVSKEAAARVFRAYTHRHFTERAFLLCSRKSLGTLLNIAESENLAKFVKRVIFCVDEVANPHEPPFTNNERYPTLTPEESNFLRISQLEKRETKHMLQRVFKRRDLVQLLALIFSRFRQLGHRPAVRVAFHFDDDEPKPHRYGTLCAETGAAPVIPQDFGYFRTVMDALAVSDVRIEEFELASGDVPVPMYDVSLPEKVFKDTALAFTHLRRLKLWIWNDEEAQPKHIQRANEFFPSLPVLEELELFFECLCMLGPYGLGSPFLRKHFPALRKLFLFNWEFRFSDIVRFLQLHTGLQAAKFNRCRFSHLSKEMEKLTNKEIGEELVKRCGIQDVLVKSGTVTREEEPWLEEENWEESGKGGGSEDAAEEDDDGVAEA